MRFEIIEGHINHITEEYYVADGEFDSNPARNSDICIAVAYLNLGVDSSDMCVKCLWGFSPRESWHACKLDVPTSYIDGQLKLLGKYEPGLSWRIDDQEMWKSHFDESTGWYCLGNSCVSEKDKTVKVADNMLMVINADGELVAVWVRPLFVED